MVACGAPEAVAPPDAPPTPVAQPSGEPPRLCVEVPAPVIEGTSLRVDELPFQGPCAPIDRPVGTEVLVEARVEGGDYKPVRRAVVLQAGENRVVMPPLRPVGNLMAPPRPVGNLMAPPKIKK